MDLTEEWLTRHATAGSFERAEKYYEEGRILRLIKRGDVYQAEIQGSKPYHQVVDLSGSAPEMTCTCPYRGGGYCKHLVAVGLAILDGKYDVATEAVKGAEDAPSLTPAELDQWWDKATDGQKQYFLRQLLSKQPQLHPAWVRYMEASGQPTLRVDHMRVRRSIVAQLAEVNLRDLNDEELALEPLSDDPSWELAEASLWPQLERAFESVRGELARWRKEHDWPNTLVVLLAWYEGIQEALIARPDEWEAWQDEAWSLFYRAYHHAVDAMSLDMLSFYHAKWMMGRLLERWDHFEQSLNLVKPHLSIRYDLRDWSTLAQVLIQDEVTARFVDTRIQAYGLQGSIPAEWARQIQRWG